MSQRPQPDAHTTSARLQTDRPSQPIRHQILRTKSSADVGNRHAVRFFLTRSYEEAAGVLKITRFTHKSLMHNYSTRHRSGRAAAGCRGSRTTTWAAATAFGACRRTCDPVPGRRRSRLAPGRRRPDTGPAGVRPGGQDVVRPAAPRLRGVRPPDRRAPPKRRLLVADFAWRRQVDALRATGKIAAALEPAEKACTLLGTVDDRAPWDESVLASAHDLGESQESDPLGESDDPPQRLRAGRASEPLARLRFEGARCTSHAGLLRVSHHPDRLARAPSDSIAMTPRHGTRIDEARR
jgi:hypothetical protein